MSGAIFGQNFQKLSEVTVFLHILTWKLHVRYRGVQFFMSPLATWLRTRRFSEPTFRPSQPTNHWKSTVFHNFPNISRTCIFFLLTPCHPLFFSSLLLFSSTLLFYSSLFYSSLLFFSSLLFSSLLCFSSLNTSQV